ncbi:MAG: class I SAM-dependent methyltransferase [Phycisphaeraceae bacterium]|nr:class I SAM-dependent methyltransferase [Phycisphaeraceae bacterium]
MTWHQRMDRLYWWMCNQIVPGQKNSQYAYLNTLEHCLTPADRWLDMGCGHTLVPAWIKQAQARQKQLINTAGEIIGIDCDDVSLQKNQCHHRTVKGSLYDLPFEDQSFDLLTANMVVEHIDDPDALFSQVKRVLKPGGNFIFHTPNKWSPLTCLAAVFPQKLKNKIVNLLDGRAEADVFPTHYHINTASQIDALAKAHGLQVVEIKMVNSSADTAMLGPLVIVELLYMRLTNHNGLRNYRTNIVTVLQRPIEKTQLLPSRNIIMAKVA